MMTNNPSDYGTPELAKHFSLKPEETMQAGRLRARNVDASKLDWYHNRHHLSKDQDEAQAMYDAGSKLARDWKIIGAEPSTVAQYSDMIPGGGMSFAEAREDARTRYGPAVKSITTGQESVIQVCCYDEAVGQYRMEVFRRGLIQLARHYGLT